LTSHISIVSALVHESFKMEGKGQSFRISRKMVMQLSHIKGIATYHKCIKNLIDWGYIRYEPSYDPSGCTTIWIIFEFY
jgi:hypothetical protein